MDWTYKAVLTAMTVADVLMVARLMGRRVAGLLAGLPVITVPALLWLAQEQGLDFAVHSAVGSAVACAMAPWFAGSFVLLARRSGAFISLAGAAVTAGLAVSLLHVLEGRPLLALGAVVLSCAFIQRCLGGARQAAPAQRVDAGAGHSLPPAARAGALVGEPWITAVLAGIVSATVAVLALRVGPYWSGVLSTLPLISACALVHLHRASGSAALPGFVSGYLVGVMAKAFFLCSFAWAAPHWGTAPALVLAALAGTAGAMVLAGWHGRARAPATPVAARAVRL
jgi:hypothetical protein